ncbi:MAG: hypothetical protein WC340_14215 [Kiritimatiellia bacterium]
MRTPTKAASRRNQKSLCDVREVVRYAGDCRRHAVDQATHSGQPRLRLTITATMLVDDFTHAPNRPPTSSHSIVGRCRFTSGTCRS